MATDDSRQYIDPAALADTPLSAPIDLADIDPELRLDFGNVTALHHTNNQEG